MGDFLDRAERLITQAGTYREAFETVFRARAELQSVHSKANIDLDNLEAVFAAFEMAALHSKLGNLTTRDLVRLPSAIRLLIARTLELSVIWPAQGAPANEPNRNIDCPGAYGEFARLVVRFLERHGRDSASVITFNYDVAADYSLERMLVPEGVTPHYALGPIEERPNGTYLDLMKLHGSLNWTQCSQCHAIQTWPISEFLRERPFQRTRVNAQGHFLHEELRLELLDAIARRTCAACGGAPMPQPMVVPPTWSKTQYYERLTPVWRRAAQHLREAENIVLVGYSLTATDESFRYLFALGTVGPTWIRRFWVFDWSGTPEDYRRRLEDRYRDLLGIATAKRFRIMFESFGWAVREVERHLDSF
jgi:hypothetical protein